MPLNELRVEVLAKDDDLLYSVSPALLRKSDPVCITGLGLKSGSPTVNEQVYAVRDQGISQVKRP
jgi:hypothetical protein